MVLDRDRRNARSGKRRIRLGGHEKRVPGGEDGRRGAGSSQPDFRRESATRAWADSPTKNARNTATTSGPRRCVDRVEIGKDDNRRFARGHGTEGLPGTFRQGHQTGRDPLIALDQVSAPGRAAAGRDAPRSREEFDARDERELSWGLGSLIALADVMIVNEGLWKSSGQVARKMLDSIG